MIVIVKLMRNSRSPHASSNNSGALSRISVVFQDFLQVLVKVPNTLFSFVVSPYQTGAKLQWIAISILVWCQIRIKIVTQYTILFLLFSLCCH